MDQKTEAKERVQDKKEERPNRSPVLVAHTHMHTHNTKHALSSSGSQPPTCTTHTAQSYTSPASNRKHTNKKQEQNKRKKLSTKRYSLLTNQINQAVLLRITLRRTTRRTRFVRGSDRALSVETAEDAPVAALITLLESPPAERVFLTFRRTRRVRTLRPGVGPRVNGSASEELVSAVAEPVPVIGGRAEPGATNATRGADGGCWSEVWTPVGRGCPVGRAGSGLRVTEGPSLGGSLRV